MATLPNDLASSPGDMARFVACSAAPDNCPAGHYCASNGSCAPGCKADVDCAGDAGTPRCLVADHQCVACLGEGDCAAGKICSASNSCVDGCDPQAPHCPSAQMCCTSQCIDTTSDVMNCGSCGHACNLPSATATCSGSSCAIKSCNAGASDCNGMASDGCECANPGDANHGCCPSGVNAGKCEGAHSDGMGDNFWDCWSHGTFNQNVATDAALAYNPKGTPSPANCMRNGTTEQLVCMSKGNDCVCFTYADNSGTSAYVGLARKTSQPAACTCAFGGGDKMDIVWN
jgi:hypothetical protein